MQPQRPEVPARFLDRVLAALLAGFVPLHIMAWSAYPPDADPVNFFMALGDFDVSQDRPHPPGYPGYVLGGRLLALLAGAQHAYQLLNLLLLLLTSVALYAVLRHAGRAATGVALVAVTITHPLALAATVIAESYVSDLAFSVLVFATVYFASLRRKHLALSVFAVFLACGMFRAVSCVMLIPLALATAAVMNRTHWKRQVAHTLLAAVCATALAYASTVLSAGGLESYRAATARVMGGAFSAASVLGGAPLASHLRMLGKFLGWFAVTALLYPVLLAGAAAIGGGWQRSLPRLAPADRWLLAAWIAPSFAFYALVYYLKPTYHLVYLAPLLYIAVAMAQRLTRQVPRLLALVIAAIVVAQLAFFFFGGPRLPAPLYRLTRAYIEHQDERMKRIAEATKQLSPADMLVWVGAPALSPYLARLVEGDEAIAVYDATDRSVHFWHPYSIRWDSDWSSVTKGRGHLGRIMVVADRADGLNISWHDVPPAVQSAPGFESFMRAVMPSPP